MKINWKHVAHDVVVWGGIAEAVLSVAGTLGPHLPAGDVAVIAAVSGAVGSIVSIAENVAAGANPQSKMGKLLKGVVGYFATPPNQATTPPG